MEQKTKQNCRPSSGLFDDDDAVQKQMILMWEPADAGCDEDVSAKQLNKR